VAAAVVLEALTSSNKPAAAAAQQELLVLLLGQQAKLPQQQAQALLQQGLAGKLSDSLTAKVRMDPSIGCYIPQLLQLLQMSLSSSLHAAWGVIKCCWHSASQKDPDRVSWGSVCCMKAIEQQHQSAEIET
jgi:hypothetical protein